MSIKAVYLITGANRGIGKGLALLLLQREHTTVIATMRSAALAGFRAEIEFPPEGVHPTSRLIPLALDEDDASISSASVEARLSAAGVTGGRLDVVVANAGASVGFRAIADTDPDDALRDFTVNALGPMRLFRACWPLLRVSGGGGAWSPPKFVLVSSSVGSIGALDQEGFPSTAYGMSKAAANWWAKKLSLEFKDEGLKVGIVHPGWVKTPMGQGIADTVDWIQEPPMTVGESALKIDNLSMDNSGKFVSYDGKELPW